MRAASALRYFALAPRWMRLRATAQSSSLDVVNTLCSNLVALRRFK
jgi:hypothetical protein